MEQNEHFDLCVIGGGSSGYAAAMRAIDFGRKVLLVEKEKIGGAGIFNGALSSKTMWEYSQKVAAVRSEVPGFEVNFAKVLDVVEEAVYEKKFQMDVHLTLLKKEAKQRLLYLERGTAKLVSKNEVSILKPNKEIKNITADYILLATGSRPRKLASIPVDGKTILTSDDMDKLVDFPKSMVILGAGVIGCEFATIFSNFGKTKVYIIDKADRILPFEDSDVSEMVSSNMEKNGVVIHKNSSLEKMEIKDGMVEYELKHNDGSLQTMRVEKALISVGRIANVENLGLEDVGVKLTERGSIWDQDTQTSIDSIFVAGDLTSEIALVNVGEREGRHAVVRMFGTAPKPLVYKNISTIMFLNPEVASVGMGEQDASRQGISYKVAKIDFTTISRAIAMRKTTGFFKILVSNDEEMRILGMRAVGEHASSAIQAVALLIYMNKGIDELGHMLHPHPSIIEGIQECARMLLGKSIYKSSMFKDKLKCYKNEQGVITPLENL
jgi:dihydrolipoamide dehydrogenase